MFKDAKAHNQARSAQYVAMKLAEVSADLEDDFRHFEPELVESILDTFKKCVMKAHHTRRTIGLRKVT